MIELRSGWRKIGDKETFDRALYKYKQDHKIEDAAIVISMIENKQVPEEYKQRLQNEIGTIYEDIYA